MPIQTVQHIADVSFSDHFLNEAHTRPVNGKLKVNHNTFDVTFDNGRVRAKFASGSAFANWFRSGTLSRFTRTLQAQYDAWVQGRMQALIAPEPPQVQVVEEPPQVQVVEEPPQEQVVEEQPQLQGVEGAEPAQTLGFEDNPDAPKVADVVADFKAVLDKVNPPGKDKFLNRLDNIATLAALRNTLTNCPTGQACNDAVIGAGFLTHFADNTSRLDEKGKKGYVLNMLDTVINGLLQAASQMKDKDVQVVDFLRKFDGACIEAKIDNIQEWLARDAGIANAAHSDSSHDLAYSVTVEFEEIAKEVRKPFEEEARTACEAEVRADCEQKGITDEAEIKEKIDARVATALMKRDGEIAPKIQEAIKEKGKFRLYSTLVGALRPVTEIANDQETGKWTVTTLVDNEGKPVLKPVSAYDIDRNFDKLVEMYADDAILMGKVENKTAVGEPVYATREDYRCEGVIAKLDEYLTGKADVAELVKLVKADISYDLGLSDEELTAKVKRGLADLAGTKKGGEAWAKKSFYNFVNYYADGTYLDKKDDLARLVHLMARHTEVSCAPVKMYRARIEDVSARCAQMMANAFRRYNVDIAKLKTHIETTLNKMVDLAFGKEGGEERRIAGMCLNKIMPHGVLFADSPLYDIGHRAAGAKEGALITHCKAMVSCIKRFAGVPVEDYLTKIQG